MALNPILIPLSSFLAISGIIQGLLWFTAALLSVLTYTKALTITWSPVLPTHEDALLSALQQLFFSDTFSSSMIVTRDVFLGFSIAYLALSFIWIAASMTVYGFSRGKSAPGKLQLALVSYSGIVLLNSLLDAALMSLLAIDYSEQKAEFQNVLGNSSSYYMQVIGILMALAARGVVLWLLNVGAVLYIWYFVTVCDMEVAVEDRRRFPPIDAYREYAGAPSFAEAINVDTKWHASHSGYRNDGFQMEPSTPEVRASLSRPQRDYSPPTWPTSTPVLPSSSNATVGPPPPPLPTISGQPQYAKPNKMTASSNRPPPPPLKPMKVAPPVPPMPKAGKNVPPIPFPDYSPPQSPTDLRPALKQTSSYY